jgi:hypothetical protein
MSPNSNSSTATAAFGLAISSVGLFWLSSMPRGYFSIADRLGYIAVVLSVLAVWLIAWSAIIARLAIVRNWSPHACMKSGALVAFLGLAFFAFAHGGLHILGILLGTQGFVAGVLCRKFAYPRMTEKEFANSVLSSHEPPHLFPH